MIYQNGNVSVSLDLDSGTRILEYENDIKLDFPTSIDLRTSTSCSFADNICKNFCSESAVINGKDCDYELLKSKLRGLPKGIELAVGVNQFNDDIMKFFVWCKLQGYIVNITINQGHVLRDEEYLKDVISAKLVYGIGVSYRNIKWNIPQFLLNYKHTVFHTIIGIDNIKSVMELKDKGVKKILVLGEKNIGYNKGKVNTEHHKLWIWWIGKLFDMFNVVSFDNLALEQLNMKRYFNEDNWNTFNNEEHSMYIDAVTQVFKPSSRSESFVDWNNIDIKDYFKQLENESKRIN